MGRRQNKGNIFLMILALFSGILPIVTFSACYVTAFNFNHVEGSNKIPPMSHLGDHAPEKLIFSIGFSATSLMQMTVVFAKYAQILSFRNPVCPLMNIASCYFGWLMIFGQLLISSIKRTDAAWAHYFGKGLWISATCLYVLLHAYISIQQRRNYSRFLPYFRTILAALTVACPFLLLAGMNFEMLHRLAVPQGAELALVLLTSVFWISMSVDFHDKPINIFHLNEAINNRIERRVSSRKGDNHKAIILLSDIMEKETP